jgi:hypothetical protein
MSRSIWKRFYMGKRTIEMVAAMPIFVSHAEAHYLYH